MSNISLSSSLEECIIRYLEYCEIDKNLSQSSIKMYDFYLHDFLTWAKDFLNKEQIILKEIDIDLLKKYRINLNRRISSKSREQFKRSTQKTFMVSIRAFLKYLIVQENIELIPPEQIILGKSEERIPKVLNEDQLRDMFQVQDLNKMSGIRDRAILEVLYSTGLRVSELVGLNREDVNLNSGEFSVVGKGRKVRTVYLSNAAIRWLKRYLNLRNDAFIPLFIRYGGKKMEENDFEGESARLTVRSVQRIVKKYAARAGVSVDATPHTLRHTYATGLLKEGADLRSVQELLGHSNVSTTQIYTHVTNRQLKQAHKNFHKDVDVSPANDTDSGSSGEEKIISLN